MRKTKVMAMIEIKERNGNWECYVGGALYDYSSDLPTLLEILANNSADVIEFMND